MKKLIIFFFTVMMFSTSCLDDLNLVPISPDLNTLENILSEDPNAYKQILAKMYAGLALTGQQGPAGNGDVAGVDEGASSYLRTLWYLQELTTDEAVIAWNDQTIQDFHSQSWSSTDVFILAMYARIYYQIALANAFLNETTNEKLDLRGNVPSEIRQDIQNFRNEARFLRALSYWHALDLFGNPTFVTEEDGVGAFLPRRIEKGDLFDYIEAELLAIEPLMIAPQQNEYARADQAAVWMLLSKLYLNAEVYTGSGRYADALTYSQKVIDEGGFSLDTDYQHVFLADNDQSNEIIFPVAFDGLNSQSFGGTTFLVNASIGGSMNPNDYGTGGGWFGVRTTSAFVNTFDDPSGNTDSRAIFYTDGQSLEIEDVTVFADGYAVPKFRNVTRSGAAGSNVGGGQMDTDFPLFRLADAYLIYAEAHLRNGGGTAATAVSYINELRERAYGNTDGNIVEADLNLDFILDERARELYWENHRRTDLVRFGQFTNGTYLWPWKGGVAEGQTVEPYRDLFPIPSNELATNPNLIQNEGY